MLKKILIVSSVLLISACSHRTTGPDENSVKKMNPLVIPSDLQKLPTPK